MLLTQYRPRGVRLDPWRDFDELRNRLDRYFLNPFEPEAPNGLWMPAVDVTENEEELLVMAELPGIEEKDVTVEFENNVLMLRGEKKVVREQKEETSHVVERTYGAFERRLLLPRTIEEKGVRAEFRNGVLTVHLPKRAEAKGRKIPIAQK
jgi:HSP20 family protein